MPEDKLCTAIFVGGGINPAGDWMMRTKFPSRDVSSRTVQLLFAKVTHMRYTVFGNKLETVNVLLDVAETVDVTVNIDDLFPYS